MLNGSKKHNTAVSCPIQKAVEYGIDIEMLKANLNRSIAERFARHQSALNLVRLFQKAKKI
jgi:hypothetical protein